MLLVFRQVRQWSLPQRNATRILLSGTACHRRQWQRVLLLQAADRCTRTFVKSVVFWAFMSCGYETASCFEPTNISYLLDRKLMYAKNWRKQAASSGTRRHKQTAVPFIVSAVRILETNAISLTSCYLISLIEFSKAKAFVYTGTWFERMGV
jgi:hypothetical protein